jgi:hypothetical protein
VSYPPDICQLHYCEKIGVYSPEPNLPGDQERPIFSETTRNKKSGGWWGEGERGLRLGGRGSIAARQNIAIRKIFEYENPKWLSQKMSLRSS